MTTYTSTELIDEVDVFDALTAFERIRPQRETAMPVASARFAVRGRQRSRPSKRRRRTPQRCSSAANRRLHWWN